MAFVRTFLSPALSVIAFFFVTALATPVQGLAATRCISSTADFQSIMDTALASAETFEDVRIKEGIYNFSSGSYGYFGVAEGTDKVLQISGGWSGTPGNCTTRSNNVGATILWGGNQRKVFGINASTTFTGSFIIDNMTIGGGFSSTNASGMCLGLGEQNGGVAGIRVERVYITNCSVATNSGIDAPAVSLVSTSALLVRNNVIENNSNGTGVIFSSAVKGGVGYILNNTIVNNTTGNINGFTAISTSGSNGTSVLVANNLFDLNVATVASRIDIRVGNDVTLQNNRFTGLSGVPVANTGSTSGPAGFLEPGDYNLTANSPAVDAGAFFAPILQGAFDIAGQTRIYGSAVDLGAFEFTLLFRDGFETE